MAKGYIYVLINPSINNCVKIGKTYRDPENRVKELSSATGVATPFILIYKKLFDNCDYAEKFIHMYLEDNNYRLNKNREFFEVPPHNAIEIINKIYDKFNKIDINDNDDEECTYNDTDDDETCSTNFKLEDGDNNDDDYPEELFIKAIAYYYGRDDCIQDYDEALTYFIKASELNYAPAYAYIGDMYRNGCIAYN